MNTNPEPVVNLAYLIAFCISVIVLIYGIRKHRKIASDWENHKKYVNDREREDEKKQELEKPLETGKVCLELKNPWEDKLTPVVNLWVSQEDYDWFNSLNRQNRKALCRDLFKGKPVNFNGYQVKIGPADVN